MIPVKCKMYLKLAMATLAGGAQWIEHWPAKWQVFSLIPGWGICLGCGPGPQFGAWKRQPIDLMFLSLTSPPSKK